MEKYGFIYIWFDRKRKMYYVGCHWGTIDDGYICSSNRMRDAYRRRPQDFKRRILISDIKSREETLEKEHQWFSLIKEEELGKKYYNLRKHKWGHWSTDINSRLTVGQKISASPNRAKNIGLGNKGKKVSEETKQLLREANKKQFEYPHQRELRRQKSLELWSDPDYRRINTENKKGFKQSEEQIQKRIETCKKRWNMSPKKGKPRTEEDKKKISDAFKNTIWINNGKINKRIPSEIVIPEGFVKGRCEK